MELTTRFNNALGTHFDTLKNRIPNESRRVWQIFMNRNLKSRDPALRVNDESKPPVATTVVDMETEIGHAQDRKD